MGRTLKKFSEVAKTEMTTMRGLNSATLAPRNNLGMAGAMAGFGGGLSDSLGSNSLGDHESMHMNYESRSDKSVD